MGFSRFIKSQTPDAYNVFDVNALRLIELLDGCLMGDLCRH
jgi:hypothetical protein